MDEFGEYSRRRLDEEEFVPGTDTLVIRATLRVYGSAFLIMLVAFCLLRKRYPKLYHVRAWSTLNDLQCELAKRDYGLISWTWQMYRTTDDELLEQCGMDALCFLRILHFGFKVSWVGIFNSFWLLPVYATAPDNAETDTVIDPVEELTTSHVPSESRRFIGTVVGAYILFIWTMYLILQEFTWYTKFRHKFLSRRGPRNYAVYVTGIPDEFRSSGLLLEYFIDCFTRHAVLEAHVAVDIPNLNKLVERREVLVTKLEHALAIKHIRGYNPTHRNLVHDLSKLDFNTVDSIEAFENELDFLNKEIREEVRKLLPRPETLERSEGRRLGEACANLTPLSHSPGSPHSALGNRYRLDSNAMQLFPDFRKSPPRARVPDLEAYRGATIDEDGSDGPLSISATGPNRLTNEMHDIEAGLSIVEDTYPLVQISDEEPSRHVWAISPPPIAMTSTREAHDDAMSIGDLSMRSVEDDVRASASQQLNESMRLVSGTPTRKKLKDVDSSSKQDNMDESESAIALRQWNEALSLTSPSSKPSLLQTETTAVSIATRSSSERDESAGRESLASKWKRSFGITSSASNAMSSVGDSTLESVNNTAKQQWDDAQSLANAPTGSAMTMSAVTGHSHSDEYSTTSDENDDASFRAAEDALKQWNEAQSLTTGTTASLTAQDCRMYVIGSVTEEDDDDIESAVHNGSRHDQGGTVSEVHASLSMGRHGSSHGASQLESNKTCPTMSGDDREHADHAMAAITESFVKARNTLTSVVVGRSNQIVKVVTGSSTENVARHIGDAAKEVSVDNVRKIAEGGIKIAAKHGKNSIIQVTHAGTNVMKEAVNTAVHLVFSNDDGVPRDAGFVVFKKLATAQAALGMIHSSTPYVMDVEEAPEPDDIFWKNVGKSHRSRQLGSVLSFAASATLCFFWTIPVSFISSLTEVDSLKETLPFLETIIENNLWIEPALAQIAPLMLIILNLWLPAILGYFAKLEGHIASSALEASLFVKLSMFQIIQTFFVSAISGGIYAQLAEIIDDPGSLVTLLANSLPAQGTFFVQILLVTTFVGQGLELLRVVPLTLALIRTKIGLNLTKKERNKPVNDYIRPLSDPRPFEHAEVFANLVLYFMVLFVYAIISPIVSYFVAFCFLIMGSGYRYQFIHNYPSTPDSGGKLWSGFIGICLSAMIIAQVTLVGLLALKKAAYATPCMVPLIIMTICFIMHLRVKHFRVANSLPTVDCMKLDRANGKLHFEFVQGKYLQPSLRARDEYPEVEDVVVGAGITT